MSEQLKTGGLEFSVSPEYREALNFSWVGVFVNEQLVLRFLEDPEGYNAKRISWEDYSNILDNKWAPGVLLHLDSYQKLSDFLRRRRILGEDELLDPIPWLFNEQTLVFFQKDAPIALEMDFDFETYFDTPYYERLIGMRVPERFVHTCE